MKIRSLFISTIFLLSFSSNAAEYMIIPGGATYEILGKSTLIVGGDGSRVFVVNFLSNNFDRSSPEAMREEAKNLARFYFSEAEEAGFTNLMMAAYDEKPINPNDEWPFFNTIFVMNNSTWEPLTSD